MPFGKGRRKLLLGIGLLLLVLAVGWCSMGLWFPWVLGPIARKAGLHYTSYQRRGYGGLELRNVTFTNAAVRIEVDRIESFIPSIWAWNLAFGGRSQSLEFVRIEGFDCSLLASDTPASPALSQLQDITTLFGQLSRWLPRAELKDGKVRSGDFEVKIAKAELKPGALDAVVDVPKSVPNQTFLLHLQAAAPMNLELECPGLDLMSSFVTSTNAAGFVIKNSTIWRMNKVELEGNFGVKDVLPESATLTAPKIIVPGSMLKLTNYATITGAARGRWHSGQFDAGISARAEPLPSQTNWPPAQLETQIRGDTNHMSIQRFEVSSPFLQASLSNQLDLTFAAPFFRAPAQLNLTADLDRQHWFETTGQVSGSAQVEPGPQNLPRVVLRLEGKQVGNAALKAKSLRVLADIRWPRVERASASAEFDDGSQAKVEGALDLERNTVGGGHAELKGPLARRWLPSGYSYGTLALDANVEGPLTNLTHSGRLDSSDLTLPGVHLSKLILGWKGEDTDLQHFSLKVSGTNTDLTCEGHLALGNVRTELELRELSLLTNGSPALALGKPFKISYEPGITTNRWHLEMTPMEMGGPAGELGAEGGVWWPERGNMKVSLSRVSSGFFSAIAPTTLPRFEIQKVDAAGSWSNGPVDFRISASATGTPQATSTKGAENAGSGLVAGAGPAQLLSTPLTLQLNLAGDAKGIVLSNLVVMSPTSSVLTAQGNIPAAIDPAGTNLLAIRWDDPLSVEGSIRPEAFFWKTVSDLAGIDLVDPSVDMKLRGTMRGPQGQIKALARQIKMTHPTLTNLALSDLRLELELERNVARLSQGQVFVQGQRVGLTGELPLDDQSWDRIVKKQLPAWNKATGQIAIDNAKLAAFEPLFPEVIAPQGELSVDLRLLPETQLEGALTLRHARTRPLGNTAPVRDINVTLRFANRVLALENATANLSGAVVELAGRADLRGTNWMSQGLPPFALTLQGTNVPLARSPEYIIRSDLNLAVVKTNDAPPLITGTAHLRDSFYLSDLSALVPSKVSTPAERPPFFSIDNPSVADWRLNVNVEGVRWLQLRTSLFNGEGSANLHLVGTAKDPIVWGGAKVDSGIVRFPFANLQVQQGLVTLTSQDPYHPQLLVRAATKQFGYDIRMEISGSIDSPIIQFTSNPALSSEQILLMITAGQLPQGSFTLTPQQRAQTVALFLGRDVLSKLGLGDQSQERLTISSGEEVSVQNKPTYHVEYKLTPRWSLTGEYDRFGDFNAGFKWRVYSK